MKTQWEELVEKRLLKLEERITVCESKISQGLEWLENMEELLNE